MIDEIGIKILNILQGQARIPNVEVARQVGMAPSAVLERIRKLEKQGVIDGYEVRLNPEFFRRSLVAFVLLRTDPADGTKDWGLCFSALPEVQEVHFLSGLDGYLLKVRTADHRELERLLREKILPLAPVRSHKTHIVLSTQKETAKIPLHSIDPATLQPDEG
ncbi:MAG: Lrp/AsnC family transcriptional regulator [Thermodesulfobacteriota bacterium]